MFSFANITFACDFLIENYEWYFTDGEINGETVQAGDEICIKEWDRWYLKFIGLRWSKNNPIVIKNEWWLVSIDTDHTYGLALSDSKFIHIRWDWDSNYKYGIKVKAPKAWHVVSIGGWSTDIEVSNLEIYGDSYEDSYSALWAKTDPKCGSDFVRWKFEMKNIVIHDNYIHDINQWFYLWWTFFTREIDCGGDDIMWHVMQWVEIYDNIIKRVGQDGLQVSSAISTDGECKIYNNYLEDISLKNKTNQKSFVTIWAWSDCDVYDNIMIDGYGPWVLFFGYNGDIYNNFILNAGWNWESIDGIFIDHRSGDDYEWWTVNVYSNTIINPARNGIRFYNKYLKDNDIADNLIVNPWFDAHQNHWARKENWNYIYLEKWRIDRDEINDWDDIWDYLSVIELNEIKDIDDIGSLGLSDIDDDLLDEIKDRDEYWVREFFSLYQDLLEAGEDYDTDNEEENDDEYNKEYGDFEEENIDYFVWWSLFDFYFPTKEDIVLVKKVVKLIDEKYWNKKNMFKKLFRQSLENKKLKLKLKWILSEIVESI